jgi:hypothetical protein
VIAVLVAWVIAAGLVLAAGAELVVARRKLSQALAR